MGLLIAAFVCALVAIVIAFGIVDVSTATNDAVGWLAGGFAAYVLSILIGDRGG